MNKTKRMLEAEEKIGEPLEEYLKKGVDNGESFVKIGKRIGVTNTSIINWLSHFGIETVSRSVVELSLERLTNESVKDHLEREYVTKRRPPYRIAKDLGVSTSSVVKELDRFGIKKRGVSEARLPAGFNEPSKEQLKTWYIDEQRSLKDIGRTLGVSRAKIRFLLEKNQIDVRNFFEVAAITYGISKPSKDQLEQLYNIERKSINEISQLVNVNPKTMRGWFEDYGIVLRSRSESRLPEGVKRSSLKQLKQLYVDEEKTTMDVAKIMGVNSTTIARWLKDEGIPIRNPVPRIDRRSIPSKEKLEEMYKNGKNIPQISRELGVSTSYMLKLFKKEGIEVKSRSVSKLPHGFKKPNKDELERLYEEGGTLTSISKGLGISPSTLRNFLKEYRIPQRQVIGFYDEKQDRKDIANKLVERIGKEPRFLTVEDFKTVVNDKTCMGLIGWYKLHNDCSYAEARNFLLDDLFSIRLSTPYPYKARKSSNGVHELESLLEDYVSE